jgi:hypothetical protein
MTTTVRLVLAFTALGLLGAAACGGSSAPQATPDPTGVINPEAGVVPPDMDAAPEAAALGPDPVDPSYPTKHTPIPNVDDNGGGVLVNPKVVTITYVGDTKVADLEDFGDTITSTKWWDTVRDGYCDLKGDCVGQGMGAGHVHLSDTPKSSYTDSADPNNPSTIQDMIKGYVADGTFPAPDKDTLYAIYFPSTVSITLDGSGSCNEFGAYHNSTVVTAPAQDGGPPPGPIEVAYAIMPRCSGSLNELTISASHEFIEASTDPQVSAPAYYMQNQIWAMLGGEVGDLCVSYTGDDTYQEGKYIVQRSWSNKAAAASHDPCVPAPAPADQPYFNLAPATGQDQVSMKVGDSKTITLTGFSDAPMDDWSVSAREFSSFQGGSNVLTFVMDRQVAHNGSKINLTITLNAKPQGGYAIYSLTSKSKTGVEHSWPMAVLAN